MKNKENEQEKVIKMNEDDQYQKDTIKSEKEIKLSALEFEKIQNSQKTKQQIDAELISLGWAENSLNESKERLSKFMSAFNQEQKQLSDSLLEKYGKGAQINLQTGIVTQQEPQK